LNHNVAGNGKRDGVKINWMEQWATSSQASLETEMKVQRLSKLPDLKMEGVDHHIR